MEPTDPSRHIEVLPPEVIFPDIQPNQTYEMTVLIKNLTPTARRLRIFQPNSLNFRCDYDLTKAIAPGLALKVLVSFETTTLHDFSDSFKVVSDQDFSLEVPLKAYPARGQIVFEPFVNLGFLPLNKEKTEFISFKNEGKTLGKVELRFDKLQEVTVDPNFFTIQPNQEVAVRVNYQPREAGILKGRIEVIVEGQSFLRTIEVTAVAVDYNRFFIDEKGNIVTKLDFGHVYYGQKKETTLFLLNNTPKVGRFQAKLTANKHAGKPGLEKYISPHELGVEELERVFICQPNIGVIEPYAQIKLHITCHPRITEKTSIWTRHFTLLKEEPEPLTEKFSFTGSCEFSDQTEDEYPGLLIVAQAVCPMVKISTLVLNFGECAMNDRRDLRIEVENKNPHLPIDYTHEHVAGFKMTPCPGEVKARSKVEALASFLPKSLGTFLLEFSIYLLDGQYSIPMRLFGKSSTIAQKEVIPRGVETVPEDFSMKPKVIEHDQFDVHVKKRRKRENLLHSFSMENVDMKSLKLENPMLDEEEIYKELNKQKYDKYIKDQRKARIKKKRELRLKDEKSSLETKFKELEMLGSSTSKTEETEEDEASYKKTEPPIDYEFLYGPYVRTSESPKLQIPKDKDSLYVSKPILNYEPLVTIESLPFNPTPTCAARKPYPKKPRNHAEARDCAMSLDAAQLKKIFAGPKVLEFGSIYIKSTAQRVFTVRNDLKTCIMVRLATESEELKTSFQEPQIVPSTETAHFPIVLSSPILQDFKGSFKYIVNEKYSFEFLVTASVEAVRLEVDSKTLRFFFGDDSDELEVTEKLRLKNPGNDFARFTFELTDNKVFTAEPQEGRVAPYQTLDVNIIYKPSGTAFGRPEEEKIVMKIEDGMDLAVKCTGIAPDSKCSIKETEVDMGEIQVSQRKECFVNFKNHMRHATAFRVVKDLPAGLEVWPMKDRVGSEENKTVKLAFCHKEEIAIKDFVITFQIKGGKVLKLPFSVKTILPNVEVIEDLFDFGQVTTLGNPGTLRFSMRNHSNIKANLIIDLREGPEEKEKQGLDCLELELIETELSKKGDSTVIVNIDQSEETEKPLVDAELASPELLKKVKAAEKEQEESSSSSEEEEEAEETQSRYSRISIQPQQTLFFQLRFSPKEVRNYAFALPLTLEGYGTTEGLTRWIMCQGVKPKLLIDPQVVDFRKKIISSDKFLPKKMEVTLMNADSVAVKFAFDTGDLDTDKVFSITPSEGILKPGETINLEACFNPLTQMSYERKSTLFIDGEKDKPYLDVSFKGNGAYPKLVFDRREIIMPVVPINVVSRCVFRVINDGFENLLIKHILPKEIGFHLDVVYLEGKNIGVTHNKLKIEAIFSAKQPISFTTRLEFLDSDGRSYMIPISGTSDNSLFTNYPYLMRTPMSEYRLKSESDTPILLEENLPSDDVSDTLSRNPGSNKKASSVISSRSSVPKNLFGYPLIPNELLSNSLDTIQRWLNHFVLSSAIQAFPDDVIASHGSMLFDLYTYLCGKAFQGRARFDQPMKRVERVNLLIKQYEDFLKLLMIEGALLNTIRPYYLLSFSDFTYYLKTHPVAYLNPSSFKPTAAQFSYLSADAWITLFYQIMKVFYLSRITPKSFKRQFPQQRLPEHCLQESNLYSVNEAILLRWIELYQPDPTQRIHSFDRDLKSCHQIASIIQGYINTPTIKGILNLKSECLGAEDYQHNAEKVLQALSFIGLENHMQPKGLANPSARENLLFLIHIYQSLLNYIPKQAPVIFSCVLGQEVVKNIELKNPTKKVISFWVKIEGNKDFTIESDTLRIEPMGKVDFQVKFQSRISQSVSARLTFFNKRESNVNAAAIVFDLRSEITERVSQELITTQSPLYQTKQDIITVKHPFLNSNLEFADFHVSLLIDKISKDPPKKEPKGARGTTSKRKTNSEAKEHKKKEGEDFKSMMSLVSMSSSPKIKSPKGPSSPKGGASSPRLGGSPKAGGGSPKAGGGSPKSLPNANPENREFLMNFLMPTFVVSKDKIHLKRGESTQISLIFLPMVYENYRCRLIFCDKEVGEFQIEVLAETLLPEVTGDIRPNQNTTIYVETPIRYEHGMSFRNEALNNAKKFHETRLANTAKYKENIMKFKQLTRSPEELLFSLELIPPSPYITLPASFLMKDPFKGQSTYIQSAMLPASNGKKNSIDEENLDITRLTNNALENKLPMDFQFKFPVSGEAHNLIMRSADNSDVRIYKLLVTANPKTIKGSLKLKCAFGDELKQELPIFNTTDRDWLIRATLTWDTVKFPGVVFSGLREFTVKRKTQGAFVLHFHPQNPLEKYEGKLSITNTVTNDHYEYDLIGFTTDPLAKGHLVIKCVAQSPEKRTIEVTNPYKDRAVAYLVETDLINAAGVSRFVIEPGKTYKYQLNLTPLIGGVYTGSITFTEEAEPQKYVWYTVSVETERAAARGELALKTEIRKTVACEIVLHNPLEEALTFEAILEGEGLLGEPTISIPPKKAVNYELNFLPLKVFSERGSVSFVNERVGEIWYDLSLSSQEQKTEKLPLIRAELGKSSDIKIYLENPAPYTVSVQGTTTNTGNFAILPDSFEIPAFQETEVTVKYTPSKLEEQEAGELLFESKEIGRWRFIVLGLGTPPDRFPAILISCPVDKDLTQIVNFKNPLREEIPVQIALRQKGAGFRLMTNKLKVTISGLTNYQIPYVFLPKGIQEYDCEIEVQMNDKVKWVFPIRGLGEYVMKETVFSYKAKSREVLNSDLKMIVPGVIEAFLKKPFTLNVDSVPAEYLQAINRCLKILPVKNSLNSVEDHLRFKVVFSPMKPFKVGLEMLLTTGEGGRWKFKLNLEATEPDRDDIIQIYSPLHKTSSVSFKLANRFKNHADFKAYFTYDSDPEFSVIPKEGTLEPYGKEGSTFIVSFTPVEYGKNKFGKLIIETDEIYWSYVIRGTFPQYKPPETSSLINNRLGSEIVEKLKGGQNKNFLLENIKKSKWTSEEKKRYYNDLGLEKSTEISSIGKVIDNSKDMSSILIQESVSFPHNKREMLSGKLTEKNESTKLTVDQSVSFNRNRNKEKLNNPIFKSYQG